MKMSPGSKDISPGNYALQLITVNSTQKKDDQKTYVNHVDHATEKKDELTARGKVLKKKSPKHFVHSDLLLPTQEVNSFFWNFFVMGYNLSQKTLYS